MTQKCPDCNGNWIDHELTCPILLAFEKQQDSDRDFFKKYPNVDTRRRKPIVEEILMALVANGQELPELPEGEHWHAAGYVIVYQAEPGVRVRMLNDAYLQTKPGQPVDFWVETNQIGPEFPELPQEGINYLKSKGIIEDNS